jgi:uncharacterized membrane-anchored protein YhcB (DUF1043 family)
MTWALEIAILLVGFAVGWVAHELTERVLWRKFNRRHERWWETK